MQNIFLQYVMSLKSASGKYGNPFLETNSDLLILDKRAIAEKSVIDNVYRIKAPDCRRYGNSVCERQVERRKHIPEAMDMKSIHLFNTPQERGWGH